jgi:DNA-binding CsgD family transcriptional regulator
MYEDRFLQVMRAATAKQLEVGLVAFAAHHEFPHMSAFVAIDQPSGVTAFESMWNFPEDEPEVSSEDAKADTVMQHCKHRSVPIAWDRMTYVQAGQVALWEKYSFGAGLASATHTGLGRHFCLSVQREWPLPSRRDHLTRMLCELQLVAALASEVAFRVMVEPDDPSAQVKLTPQELRCLQWTAAGLTAFEVGEKLNIAERTAVKHLHNAMHKLGCNNKHHAAMAAARVGLIAL